MVIADSWYYVRQTVRRFLGLLIAKKEIHLSLQNQGGSVEHYYHFLLGFLVPLTLAQEKHKNLDGTRKIYVRSCALMDEHIKSIGFPEVIITDKFSHKQLKLGVATEFVDVAELKFIECMGYDFPARYNYQAFCNVESIITTQLSNEIELITRRLGEHVSDDTPNVILINREPPHPFYTTDECEKKTAGTARRSIPNFGDLYKKVASIYPNTLSVTLERKSLAYQIALFKHADIIIAQHGAALANLLWCNQKTTLVEIHPNNLSERTKEIDYFRNLAACMKVNYRRVDQETKHSAVNVGLVLGAISK